MVGWRQGWRDGTGIYFVVEAVLFSLSDFAWLPSLSERNTVTRT